MMNKYPKVQQVNSLISCSVVGARGYTGLETARLLLAHPKAQLVNCFATSEFNISRDFTNPIAAGVKCLVDSELMQNLTDVVFLATPAEVSMELAPQIVKAGKTVIDLSGAFRLKKNDYQKWYGFEHEAKAELMNAEYGLVPWVGPWSGAKLIANPGCYATAINMGLAPVLKDNLIFADQIVIDAKSGTTGAGKKAAENLLFTEVDGECLPYKVGRHQHYPEIVEALEMVSGHLIDAHMTTSLLPVRRGIIAGLYVRLRPGKTLNDVEASFAKAYANYPLLSFAPIGSGSSPLLSLKKVVGTARTHISYEVQGDKLYLFVCIDNLLKGAASQALENFNRISDLPIETGVGHLEAVT